MIKKLQDTALYLIKIWKYGRVKTSLFLLVTLCGCLISFLAGSYLQLPGRDGGNKGPGAATATPSEATPSDAVPSGALTTTPSFLFPPVASYSDATASNAEIMRPDQLNLAYLYEEGEDTSQPAESMAGKLYQLLANKDAQWMSGIYDLYNYTPEQAAVLMELPARAVTGASGIIEEFRNIQVEFYDGDGQERSLTSNARSIVSMANILHYYGVLESMEDLEAYGSQLWEDSHSYSVSMGNVYYCDGTCLTEGNAQEDAAQESQDGDPGRSEGGESAPSAQEGTEPDTSGQEAGTSENGGEAQASHSGSGSQEAESGGGGQASLSGSGSQEAESGGGGQASHSSSGSQEAESGTEGRPSDSGDDISAGDTGGGPGLADSSDGDGARRPSQNRGEGLGEECPGHVDLSIYIMIKGLTENASLYELSPAVPSLLNAEGKWGGWNETAKGWVEHLISQDWYQQYGINTGDLLISSPLTSTEIDIYMKMLPPDASPVRRAFVKYALASVGKIPYYWGGKPAVPGYTGNDFGSIVAPDEDGRVLRGLDCSGWVNWVYWSVTGRGLGAESTSTLIGSGKAVAKSDLIPGDICIRTGPMGHVVIFLGWTEDGKMLCIQETTGNSHNVEIGIVASDWNSYRRIID